MDPFKSSEQRRDVEEPYEMSKVTTEMVDTQSPGDTPATLSARSSMAALRVTDPQDGTNVQELPPVDRGVRAWMFCASGFVLEMMVWGFSFRSVFTTDIKF